MLAQPPAIVAPPPALAPQTAAQKSAVQKTAPAPSAAKKTPAAQPFGLGPTRIGMDLAVVRTLTGVSCSPGKAAGVTVCRAPDQALGGGYFARDLTYRFLGERLVQIRFRSSIDAFSWVTAELKKDDGEPAAIRRDTVNAYGERLPHVAMTWKNGRSTIELEDPIQPPTQLSVKITRDDAAPRLADSNGA